MAKNGGDPASTERRPRLPVGPASSGEGGGDKPSTRFRPGRRFLVIVIALLAVNYITVSLLAPGEEPSVRVPYSPVFLDQVRDGNVEKISSTGTAVEGEFKREVTYPPEGEDKETATRFDTEVPTFANSDALSKLLEDEGVVINAEPLGDGRGVLLNILLGFGPVLLLVGLFIFLARRASGGAGGPLGAFGRSKARRAEPSQQTVSFDDVAGIEEAKAELSEIVDFLKNPDRYRRLGGRIPRGVLLSGEPGTGKTLLARAVAGEAQAPFFSISASEFVEAIVGVGASRVRDLFKQAQEASPAIIFIDELDAIGRSRSGGSGFGSGANDEREQTLNQILTEMDGFDSGTAVIVLAATNRPEVLDSALLRPGRFDRRVVVQAPDKVGRRKILDVHTRSLPLDDSVDLDRLASSTPGMVGADLANLCNEAALMAARRDHEKVQGDDFTDAIEKIVLGTPRNIVLSDADRRLTAYHEAGHAIVGMLTPGGDPVRKVSIIPRGMSLGVTLSTPEADRVSYNRSYLRARIRVALGGRVAEEIVFNEITTGAESDIQQITEIARRMVGRWGMSEEIGPIAVLPSDAQGPLLPGVSQPSATTQRIVDEEVHRMVEDEHAAVTELLQTHRGALTALADTLLEEETLDEDAAYAAAGIAHEREPQAEGVEPPAVAASDAAE